MVKTYHLIASSLIGGSLAVASLTPQEVVQSCIDGDWGGIQVWGTTNDGIYRRTNGFKEDAPIWSKSITEQIVKHDGEFEIMNFAIRHFDSHMQIAGDLNAATTVKCMDPSADHEETELPMDTEAAKTNVIVNDGTMVFEAGDTATAEWTFSVDKTGHYDIEINAQGQTGEGEFEALVDGVEAGYVEGQPSDSFGTATLSRVHFYAGSNILTLRLHDTASTNVEVDAVTLVYQGYEENPSVAPDANDALTTHDEPQEYWSGYASRADVKSMDSEVPHRVGHPCNDAVLGCEMEVLPRDGDGVPTADFPREQTGVRETTNLGGLTVKVGKKPNRWNDALSDTIVSPGHFNERHVFEPQQNNDYNPHVAKECCKLKAGADASVAFGCDMWLAHSSLNWEGAHWYDALNKKCKKDCMAKRMMKNHPKYQGNMVWEHEFYDALTHDTEPACIEGCDYYRQCMDETVLQNDN
jgi:hypothetical protein